MQSMKTKMNLMLTTVLYFVSQAAYAEISRPSFVSNTNTDSLDKAGESINTWLIAIFTIFLALSCIRPAFYFVRGEKDKAVESSTDIIIGAVVGVVFSGIVFGVVSTIS